MHRGLRIRVSGIPVPYFRCEVCGFLFTDFFDTWTAQAFRRFIYNDDYILVDPEYADARSIRDAEWYSTALDPLRGTRLLDWGGGGGVFAADMAKRGFATEYYDPFSAPMKPSGRFDIITCIETIEHSPDPMGALREMTEFLTDDGVIILGETLQPEDIDQIRCSWWYVAPRNGHCSTFDRRTFSKVSDQLGCLFHSSGVSGPHALHRPKSCLFPRIADCFGPVIWHVRLGAPGEAGAEWHDVEYPDGLPAYQWSAATELTWSVAVPPGPSRTVIFDLPVEHAVANFIDRCSLRVGTMSVPLNQCGRAMVGEACGVAPGILSVTLRTPPLVRAVAPDGRTLGVALRVLGETEDRRLTASLRRRRRDST